MIERPELQKVIRMFHEPNKFIRVLVGPRQVGKTTLVSQLVRKINMPYVFEAADGHGCF